jgi:hypothetical protein
MTNHFLQNEMQKGNNVFLPPSSPKKADAQAGVCFSLVWVECGQLLRGFPTDSCVTFFLPIQLLSVQLVL